MDEHACLRPDGKWCFHKEADHGHQHPLYNGTYCEPCMIDDGVPLLGPYVHKWNPHVWTVGGWLPLLAEVTP